MNWLPLFAGLLAAACGSAGAAVPGDRLPDCPPLHALPVSGLDGHVIVVDFWASWCPPCRKLMPLLDEWQTARRQEGLRVIAINVDESRADAEALLRRVAVRYPIVYDAAGVCPASFGVQGMPSTYLVDRQGVIRHVHSGFRQGDREVLETLIDALLDE
jgi:thiol-disulfide isomerase/thioredoxin